MKLLRVAIRNYKHLKNIDLDIAGSGENEKFPAFFCIGLNGSGKSAFLEAVALIFSRISQNEAPGFWFLLVYELTVDGRNVRVEVRPETDREKGRLRICVGGLLYNSFTGREKYLPYKVITCVSGTNSQMRQMLSGAARDSILSDIYDARKQNDGEEVERLKGYLENLHRNPRMLYLDEELAPYVLFALCTWTAENQTYDRLRRQLLEKAAGGMEPVAVSLVSGKKPGSALLQQLLNPIDRAAEAGLADWITQGEDSRTAVFGLEETAQGLCSPRIRDTYANPLNLLTVLLQGKESGALQECHFLFRSESCGEVLSEKALSDGEILWLARMGLALLVSHKETDNCLFLYDEPDVHLNESWNVEFISCLEKMVWQEENRSSHCFWIATHSSLLLTDALPDQVFLFEKSGKSVKARKVPISLFAAGRQEISRSVFHKDAQLGVFAEQKVAEMLQEDDPEKLQQYIDTLGPGISRIKLRERYYGKIKG